MTLNVFINRSAFVHEIQVNAEFTVGLQLADLLSEINRINAAFRNQANQMPFKARPAENTVNWMSHSYVWL